MAAATDVPRTRQMIGFMLLFTLGPALLLLGQAVLFVLATGDPGVLGFYSTSILGVLMSGLAAVAVIGRTARDHESAMRRLTVATLVLMAVCLLLPVEGILVRPTVWHLAGLVMAFPAGVLWRGLQRERAEKEAQ